MFLRCTCNRCVVVREFGGLVCFGGARVMAASEMPRPCVRNIEQAQGKPPVSKSSLTCAHSCGQYFVKSIRTVTTQDQSQKAKRDAFPI